jgi:hypothetical protein
LRGPLTSGSGLCFQKALMTTRWLSGSSPCDSKSLTAHVC